MQMVQLRTRTDQVNARVVFVPVVGRAGPSVLLFCSFSRPVCDIMICERRRGGPPRVSGAAVLHTDLGLGQTTDIPVGFKTGMMLNECC